MNALLFAAQGDGPKPTVILLHGLPGNERNLDLAQALRRVGWNVLTFTYRGAWGSDGKFILGNAIEDGEAALAFARSADGAKLGIDPRRIVIGGHSYRRRRRRRWSRRATPTSPAWSCSMRGISARTRREIAAGGARGAQAIRRRARRSRPFARRARRAETIADELIGLQRPP